MRAPNPAELHQAAVQAWRRFSDDDAARSTRFEEADARRSVSHQPEPTDRHRRAENWVAALHRYEAFWRIHARAPRENTRDRSVLPGEERRLAEWARYQRQFEDRLSVYQRVRLTVSPAFDWDPQDAAWQANWDRCARHLAITGSLPRLNGKDRAEFTLARWLGRQLRQYQTGTLLETRRALLARLLDLAQY